MVLATLIGFAVQRWADQPDAALLGALIGVLVALFVPTGTRGCSIR